MLMASLDDLKIGETRILFDHGMGNCELGPVVVVGFATVQDYLEQEVKFGYGDGSPSLNISRHKFYKVAAE